MFEARKMVNDTNSVYVTASSAKKYETLVNLGYRDVVEEKVEEKPKPITTKKAKKS